jgi:hypothetical protein
MMLQKSICALILLVLIGAQYSCQRNGSGDFIRRLESAKEIEADFQPAVRGLYTSGEKPPELAATLSKDGYSFALTATNRKDVDRVAPTLSQILKQHGVQSATLLLIGSEIVVNGKTVKTESSSYILGGFRIHADGTVEEIPADTLIARSVDAAQSFKQAD